MPNVGWYISLAKLGAFFTRGSSLQTLIHGLTLMLTRKIGAEDWRKQLWGASKRRGLFVLGLEAETLKRPIPKAQVHRPCLTLGLE